MLSKRTELINKLATSIQAYSPIIVEGDDGAGKSCFLRALCERLDELGVISDYTIRHAWDVENALLDSLCNGSS